MHEPVEVRAEVVIEKWLRGIRGTVAMILTWTVGWGLGFGGLIELLVDPSGAIVDIWFTAMAIPGFIGGALFSGLLRIAEGRRGFDEVSLVRFATWGVMTGLLLGVLVAATRAPSALSLAPAVVIAIMAALGAVAAIGSALFFRLLARRQTHAVAGPR
jgi:hypothetical protein